VSAQLRSPDARSADRGSPRRLALSGSAIGVRRDAAASAQVAGGRPVRRSGPTVPPAVGRLSPDRVSTVCAGLSAVRLGAAPRTARVSSDRWTRSAAVTVDGHRPAASTRGRGAAAELPPRHRRSGYRKRSPGRRPLVGCSQRRRARATKPARRVRSSARARVKGGRTSAHGSSPGSRGRCRPWTSPRRQQARTRGGDHLVEIDPKRGPAFLRPGAELLGQVGREDQRACLPVGVPGRQLVDQAAGGLGTAGCSRVQQPAGRHHQHPTLLVLLSGDGRPR
jgi:hypothetical protein